MLIIKDNRLWHETSDKKTGPAIIFWPSLVACIFLTWGAFGFINGSVPMAFSVASLILFACVFSFGCVCVLMEWSKYGLKMWKNIQKEIAVYKLSNYLESKYLDMPIYQQAVQEAWQEYNKLGDHYDQAYWNKQFRGLNSEMELLKKQDVENMKQTLSRTDFVQMAKDYRSVYIGNK